MGGYGLGKGDKEVVFDIENLFWQSIW
jgi:hypothetical protein